MQDRTLNLLGNFPGKQVRDIGEVDPGAVGQVGRCGLASLRQNMAIVCATQYQAGSVDLVKIGLAIIALPNRLIKGSLSMARGA